MKCTILHKSSNISWEFNSILILGNLILGEKNFVARRQMTQFDEILLK